jgi:NitT/TauT family transport system substrate-binding protein
MRRRNYDAASSCRGRGRPVVLVASAAAVIWLCAVAKAEPIKIGSVKVAAFAALFVAQEKGYFAAEGVPAQLVFFDAAQPVAVAAVSGDIDFGVTAMTAGFYSLAGQGALKLIAAANREHPGFETQAFLVSDHAFQGGLTALKNLAGHSFAVTGPGGPPVYVVGGLLADRYGFDFKTIRLVSLSTMPNINSALAGSQVDFTLSSLLGAMGEYVAKKQVHLLGWVGDEAPWQFGAVLAATKTANDRRDTVERFLRAYRKGARDYHDAVTGLEGTRQDGPNTAATVAIIAKYIDAPEPVVAQGLPFTDAEARLDLKDIIHQVDWYKSQGLLKDNVDANSVIDRRYAVALSSP